jgi:hypothetical protein
MRDPRRFIAPIALLLAAIPAAAQLRDGEWVSYRDAYRAMVRFEKFGGPKNLLVSRLRVQPGDHAPVTEGAQLTLNGKSTQLNLPLDALGRTMLPLQKSFYDENAVLVQNRKGVPFGVRPQVTIALRPDGQYDSADLQAACGQALGFARYLDASQGTRQCAGVRFVFNKKDQDGGSIPGRGREQITLAPHRLDLFRQVVVELAAQLGDAVVDAAVQPVELDAAHFLQQFVARQHAAGRLGQHQQQLVFGIAEHALLAAPVTLRSSVMMRSAPNSSIRSRPPPWSGCGAAGRAGAPAARAAAPAC